MGFKNLLESNYSGTAVMWTVAGTALISTVVASKVARNRQAEGKEPFFGLLY